MTNNYLYLFNVLSNDICNTLEALPNFKSQEYTDLGKKSYLNLEFLSR